MKHTILSLESLADRFIFAAERGLVDDLHGMAAEVKDAVDQCKDLVGEPWVAYLESRRDVLGETYNEGRVVENSWGYDQTNIQYYLIIKRTKATVTLVEIGKRGITQDGFMSGHCEPDITKVIGEPFRRKVHKNKSEREIGIAILDYGWGTLWNGRPSQWSSYA
jgi:hypothetical protein